MVANIVFHIGDHKTGSTSIQQALATRSWSCDEADLLYSAPINHIPLAEALRPGAPKLKRIAVWSRHAAAIEASRADTAVVSAEAFERVAPEVLAQAIDDFLPGRRASIRLIAYVRPHPDRLVSAYAERIKQSGFTGTLEELHEATKSKNWFHYAKRFRRWRAVFGDQLTVRPMIRDRLRNGDVVHDFMDYVFQGKPFELTRSTESNKSLSLEDLAMLREFHLLTPKHPAAPRAKQAFGWNFAGHLGGLAGGTGTKLRLHRALLRDIIDTYRDDAAAMDAEFFDGVPTMLPALLEADIRAVDEAQSIKAEKHFAPDTLRMIRGWAELAAQMLENDPESVPRHFRRHTAEEFSRLRGDIETSPRVSIPERFHLIRRLIASSRFLWRGKVHPRRGGRRGSTGGNNSKGPLY